MSTSDKYESAEDFESFFTDSWEEEEPVAAADPSKCTCYAHSMPIAAFNRICGWVDWPIKQLTGQSLIEYGKKDTAPSKDSAPPIDPNQFAEDTKALKDVFRFHFGNKVAFVAISVKRNASTDKIEQVGLTTWYPHNTFDKLEEYHWAIRSADSAKEFSKFDDTEELIKTRHAEIAEDRIHAALRTVFEFRSPPLAELLTIQSPPARFCVAAHDMGQVLRLFEELRFDLPASTTLIDTRNVFKHQHYSAPGTSLSDAVKYAVGIDSEWHGRSLESAGDSAYYTIKLLQRLGYNA
ncbi:hypothetical protein F5Y16DRAFT_403147 [Xylariaceae sp. FL0255]|nr:hypothetical protein F5Y16DRAFT_403147 [Xylariaceae sp. FL0255]